MELRRLYKSSRRQTNEEGSAAAAPQTSSPISPGRLMSIRIGRWAWVLISESVGVRCCSRAGGQGFPCPSLSRRRPFGENF